MGRSAVTSSSTYNVAVSPQRPYRLWPRTAPRLSHSSLALVTPNKFSVALRPQRLYGLLGTGRPGRPPRLTHTAPELCGQWLVIGSLKSWQPHRDTSSQVPSEKRDDL